MLLSSSPAKEGVSVFNFVVVGQVRSGSAVLASAIDASSDATCHLSLLHEHEAVRRACHESYFGVAPFADRMPEHLADSMSPQQYLNRNVFDRTVHDESAIGVRVDYRRVHALDLYDLFSSRFVEGDFGIVHVVRNPIACYISLKQAEHSRVWARRAIEPPARYLPSPLSADMADLTAFVRLHDAVASKVRASCADRFEVQYRRLFLDYDAVIRDVFEFLEIPCVKIPRPAFTRLRNRPLRDRIANFDALTRDATPDVQRHLSDDNLF